MKRAKVKNEKTRVRTRGETERGKGNGGMRSGIGESRGGGSEVR